MMKNFLIVYESGKNNLCGCTIHILKNSSIISAENINTAISIFRSMSRPLHYGHECDYVCVLDIKEV